MGAEHKYRSCIEALVKSYKNKTPNNTHMTQCPKCRAHTIDTDPLHGRTLDHLNAPQLEYKRTQSTARHAGQLKLLLSEIEFLTPYRDAEHTVIYAGAAPGTHIPRLARMFPLMRFVLVDPQPSAVHPDRTTEVIKECMTNKLAAELRARNPNAQTLLISDVRIGADTSNESDRDQQLRIQRDMQAQMEWHAILHPVASMFKFRLPWDLSTHTEYLEGEIRLPVFGKRLTHESRLVVAREAKIVPYDNRRYERQMACFNRVTRPAMHTGGRCYDCEAFRRIIADYLKNDAEVEHTCAEIEDELEARARQWAQSRKRKIGP